MHDIRIELLMAAAIMMMIPVLAVYFGMQKYFMSSNLGIGIKG
jgi:ABC-type glycerol-3-phosphate transport system permease component